MLSNWLRLTKSQTTFNDIFYLGIAEVALGLIALFLAKYNLICWAIGFGVLHIVYGSVMYFKYDRQESEILK